MPGVGLLVSIVLAVAACVVWPALRRVVIRTLAVVALTAAAMAVTIVGMGLREFCQKLESQHRIPASEVELRGLELTGGQESACRLRGLIHNRSTRYTLTDTLFELIIEDCVEGRCREQARAHGEVIRRVAPGATVAFDTDTVQVPLLTPPAGERRFSYHVWNTAGMPPS
jgi:hypothetical protein